MSEETRASEADRLLVMFSLRGDAEAWRMYRAGAHLSLVLELYPIANAGVWEVPQLDIDRVLNLARQACPNWDAGVFSDAIRVAFQRQPIATQRDFERWNLKPLRAVTHIFGVSKLDVRLVNIHRFYAALLAFGVYRNADPHHGLSVVMPLWFDVCDMAYGVKTMVSA